MKKSNYTDNLVNTKASQGCWNPSQRNSVFGNFVRLHRHLPWRQGVSCSPRLLIIKFSELPHGHFYDSHSHEVTIFAHLPLSCNRSGRHIHWIPILGGLNMSMRNIWLWRAWIPQWLHLNRGSAFIAAPGLRRTSDAYFNWRIGTWIQISTEIWSRLIFKTRWYSLVGKICFGIHLDDWSC